jgi:hypothetical protein
MQRAEAVAGEAARRVGRRAGLLVFSALVVSFTAVCAAQIVWQVWGAKPEQQLEDCRKELLGLIAALERASSAAAAERGERAAVRRFRAELEPEWSHVPGLDSACGSEPGGAHALREIERLRYAEEHAVRYESVEVARRRRKVSEIADQLQRGAPLGVED